MDVVNKQDINFLTEKFVVKIRFLNVLELQLILVHRTVCMGENIQKNREN